MSLLSTKRMSTTTSSAVDHGHKDVLVSQLRAEILELKQNDREYVELSAQLKKLESRYNLLQDEKERGEAEFKIRNTTNFDTIANLRTDMDTLKANIADTKLDIQDLRAEAQILKEEAEQRRVELQNLRAECDEASGYNNNLSDGKRKAEAELDLLRDEKRDLVGQIREAESTLDSLNHKNSELEKVMKEIEYDNSKAQRLNGQMQQTIDNLTGELRTRSDNLEVAEKQVVDTQKVIASLNGDIEVADRDNEQLRIESNQRQKTFQQEVAKNLDLTARIAVLEASLKSKEAELSELRRGNENLKNAHSNLLDNSFNLKQQLEGIRADIDATSLQNQDIVEELQRMTSEDDQVRSILNRNDRVENLKFKSESTIRKSGIRNKSAFSPSPDRVDNRSSLRKSPLRSARRTRSPLKY